MRTHARLLLVLAWSGLAAPAAAVPTTASLSVAIQGLAPITLFGGGSVGVSGSTLTVPAGLVSQVGSLTIAVTATSAVNSLVAVGISNLSATFSMGGVTAQAPGEVCPGGGPGAGQACNTGGGVGGVMALGGTINVHVIPNVVVIPVSLTGALIGQGGSTSAPFTINAAAWTTGTGLVNVGNSVVGLAGGVSPLTLVTPTFVLALGNLLPIFTTLSFDGALPVPEPAAALAIALGLAWLAHARRRR